MTAIAMDTAEWKRTRRKSCCALLGLVLVLSSCCEAAVDLGNCFQGVEDGRWSTIFEYDAGQARLDVHTDYVDANIRQCLLGQKGWEYTFQMLRTSEEIVYNNEWDPVSSEASALVTNASNVYFDYLILPGNYSVRITLNDNNATGLGAVDAEEDFGNVLVVEAPGPVASVSSSAEAACSEVTATNRYFRGAAQPYNVRGVAHVDEVSARFTFAFPAFDCGGYVPSEMAKVQFLSTLRNESGSCSLESGGVIEDEVLVPVKQNEASLELHLEYNSDSVDGNRYYCVNVVREQHLLCRRQFRREESIFEGIRPRIIIGPESPSNSSTSDSLSPGLEDEITDYTFSTTPLCVMSSNIVYLESRPIISQYLAFCTSHFACAWLYIAVGGAFILLLSCALSFCIIYCRCCCRDSKKRVLSSDDREAIPFEGLCLNDNVTGTTQIFQPKKTWLELHEEWDRQPPKNPGKLLFLYSPDSPAFKELQAAFKSFLELACHCVVLDLFDEELLREIAFDPELWLTNLLGDPDFKIIVMCSEGAFKRQQALLNGEVLNIPQNSTLDGLFSAGLKFIQDKHAYDYNRLALTRYEMLHLTSSDFRLREMVPNREFLVPTQLHELFCWIHGYDPLDLMGKPWDRYHLELQLLQDALKQARKDPRKKV